MVEPLLTPTLESETDVIVYSAHHDTTEAHASCIVQLPALLQ